MLDMNTPETIQGSIVYNPFDTSNRTDVELVFESGKPLAGYVHDLPTDVEWAVALNGTGIPNTAYNVTFPKPGDNITAIPVPEGGGGRDGKAVLALVATVALSIFAPIAGGALAKTIGLGASKLGVSLATAAVNIAGGVLISAMIPPPESAIGTTEQSYGIDGPKNTSTEGVGYPVLYGEHAFGGNYIDLYTENTTDKDGKSIQYLFGRVIASEGPIESVDQIYLNDQVVENYEEVETDFRLGYDEQSICSWFNETVTLINQNKDLSTNWQYYTTSEEVDKIRVDLIAPLGMGAVDDKGRKVTLSAECELEYSKTGENNWLPILSNAVWQAPETPDQVTKNFKININYQIPIEAPRREIETPTQLEPVTVTARYRPYQSGAAWTEIETFEIDLHDGQGASFEVNKTGLAEQAYEFEVFSSNESAVITHTVQYKYPGAVIISDDSSEIIRRSFKSEIIEEAVYDIRFRRVEEESIIDGHNDKVAVLDIGEIKREPLTLPYTAWIGFKIRLTGQLTGIPTLTGVGKGRVLNIYDHNGNIIDVRYSNNPADVLLDAYMHTRYGGQLEWERIDFAAFSEWRDYCDEKGLTFNGLFSETSNIDDALKSIFIAGRAQRVSSGAKLSVAVDRESEPTMMFGDGNIKAGSMQITYLPFADRVNDLEVVFNDKDDLYKRKSVRVTNNAALNRGEPLKSSAIELRGITERERALREGTLRMNFNRLVKRTAVWESPLEAVSCSVGDVVIVQHKMPGWGAGGRLLPDSTGSALKLDQIVTLNPGRSYRILIHKDKIYRKTNVSPASQTGNLVTLPPEAALDLEGGERPDRFISESLGVDFAILRIVDETTLVLDNKAADQFLTTVSDVSLIEVDYIEDVAVLNPATSEPVETDIVYPVSTVSDLPSEYPSFIFGEIQFTKKPFRLKSITRSADNEVSLTGVEYVPEVYLDDPEAQPHNYSSLVMTDHVTNLALEEKIEWLPNARWNRNAVNVTWDQPERGIYIGAIVEVDEGKGFVAIGKTTDTSFKFYGKKGDKYAVRVLPIKLYSTDSLDPALALVSTITLQGVVTPTVKPDGWAGTPEVRSVTLKGPTPNPDNSFAYFEIYAGGAGSAFVDATKIAQTASSMITYTLPDASTYERYWIVEVDTDGNKSEPSDPIDIRPVSDPINVPSAPVITSLTSELRADGQADLNLNFTGSADASGYDVYLKIGTREVSYSTLKENYSWVVEPGISVEVRLRAFNALNQFSDYSSTEVHTVVADTVPPAVPENVILTPGFNSIWVEWDSVPDADLDYYEVVHKTASAKPGVNTSLRRSQTTGETAVVSGLGNDVTQFVFVRSVDKSGNRSDWTNGVSATTLAETLFEITNEDLSGLVDQTSFADGLTSVEIVDTLPTTENFPGRVVVLTTDGSLYRFYDDAWTRAVGAGDINGQIQAAQIAALEASKITGQMTDSQIAGIAAAKLTGTVSSSQIASLAASKLTGTIAEARISALAASKITGQLTNAQLEAIDAAKVSGQLTNDQLEAINAAKITGQLSNAQLEAISAAKITGQLTNAQLEAIDAAKIAGQLTDAQLAEIDAAKLSGTIAEARLSSLNASKLTGTINEARIASLAAAKVTGQLTDSQIQDVAAAKISGQVVAGQIADATIGAEKLTTSIKPIEIVSSLPGAPHIKGRHVFLNSDNKTYRNTGSGWTKAVETVDLTGQITETQITDNSISTQKIAANAVTTDEIAADSIQAGHLKTNSVIAGKVAAGAIGTDQLQARSVTASRLLVTDNENMFANGDFNESELGMINGPSGTGILNFHQADSVTGGQSLSLGKSDLATGTSIVLFYDFAVSVREGEVYWCETEAKTPGTPCSAGFYYRIEWLDKDKVYLNYENIASNEPLDGNWQRFSKRITAPADAAYAVWRIYNTSANSTVSYFYIDRVVMRRANAAELIVNGSLTAEKILAGSITGDRLTASTITTDLIAASAITSAKIQTGAIIAGKLAAGSVETNSLAAGSVVAAKIASSAITADKMAANSVYAANIVSGQISTDKLAAFAVTAGKIDANAITAVKLAAGSVETDKLAAGSVIAEKIGAGQVTAEKLSAGSVETASLAAGSVIAEKIAAGAITTEKLAAGSVETANLAAGSVVADKIASNAVTTAKLSAGSVETSKLAVGSVIAEKIAAGAITTEKLAAGSVETANLAAGSVVADKIASGSVATTKLAVGSAGNLLQNSNWVSGVRNFTANSNDAALEAEHSYQIRPYGSSYAPLEGCLEIKQEGSLNPADKYYQLLMGPVDKSSSSHSFSIKADEWYEFSSRISSLRCAGLMFIYWRDADLNTISVNTAPINLNTPGDEDSPGEWPLYVIRAKAPTNAAYVQPVYRKYPTDSGTSSYLFIHQPMLARTHSAATEAVPYSPSGATYISGNEILTGAVTADKITAGAITTSKLDAGAITADKIATSAITAVKMSANSVSTAALIAGSVTTDRIAVGAITVDRMAANSVNTDQLVSNSITTAKVQAGAIKADQIAAKAITAEKMFLTDRDNLIPDGRFEEQSPVNWNTPANSSITFVTNSASGGYAAAFGKTVTTAMNWQAKEPLYVPVREGEKFWAETEARMESGSIPGGFYARIQWLDQSETQIGYDDIAANKPLTSTYELFSRLITAPANAVYAQARFYNTSGQISTIYVDRIVMRRANAAELIVDGSIVGDHIAANAITAAKIGANEIITQSANIGNAVITNAKIADATISSAKIQNLDAAKIDAGTITADKLATGSVTTDKLQAGSITADKLQTGSVTADKLQAGSVTTDKIQAGAITADKLTVGSNNNLIPNSDLSQGDLHWTIVSGGTIGSTASWEIRQPGETYAGSEFPTIQLRANADDTSSGYARIINLPENPDGSTRAGVPIDGDKYYEVSANLSIHRAEVKLVIEWSDEDGVSLGLTSSDSYSHDPSSSTDPESWTRYSMIAQAPSAARYARVGFQIGETTSATDAFLYIHKPLFGLTSDGASPMPYSEGPVTTINGDHIKTGTISAGMGIFSGPLVSDDFVTGSAGWKLDENGDAEFNNLIVRESIQVGAVSEGLTYIQTGSAAAFDHDEVVYQENLGTFTAGQFWQIATFLQSRPRAEQSYEEPDGLGGFETKTRYLLTSCLLETRYRNFGPWSDWVVEESFDGVDTKDTQWQLMEGVASKQGTYDEVEVRLRVLLTWSASLPGGSTINSTTYLANIDEAQLVAQALVR